jgi:hypothetical protein
MSAIKKLVVFLLVLTVVIVLERAWLNAIQPDVSKQLAISQLNGGDAALRDLRLFEGYKEGANIVAVFVILCAAWLLASRPGFGSRRSRIEILFGVTMIPFALGGCVRPYDRPGYAEIDTSEIGFLIPLEGDSGVQAKFQSEEYLRALKVAAKRVQITHHWSQEGRLPNSGQWIPLFRLVKANRSPVTREAQQRDNDRVELEAKAIAERARRIAAGDADAKKICSCLNFRCGRTV